ncbi:zinc-binding dehydrogenase [Candidatus Parcubacteria bacterium]|nr:zinc-binding dehydrogenase [Candidatus Parcubacteria bacterium]
MNKINALTFDAKEDGWETSKGFIMRQIDEPVLDQVNNPEDSLSVILKLKFAGVCGSDRGIFYRNAFKEAIHSSLQKENKSILILGHEFLGEVVQASSMVKHLYGIKTGDLVSGDSHITCGNCYQCKIGENNVCASEKILGISTDGIFAVSVKIPAKNLWVIDANKIRPEIGAIYDPMGNAIHAVTKMDVRGQQVLVSGCGPIGLFAIRLLKHFGASNIIAMDIKEDNLRMAKELGAHTVLFSDDVDASKKVWELTGGRGVDIAMEMAGPVPSIMMCLQTARRGGHVILFGVKDGDVTIPEFSRLVVKNGVTLHGVIGRRIFKDWQALESILGDAGNGIQEDIWNIILKKGQGTILDFNGYNKESFEKSMNENPKVVFKF